MLRSLNNVKNLTLYCSARRKGKTKPFRFIPYQNMKHGHWCITKTRNGHQSTSRFVCNFMIVHPHRGLLSIWMLMHSRVWVLQTERMQENTFQIWINTKRFSAYQMLVKENWLTWLSIRRRQLKEKNGLHNTRFVTSELKSHKNLPY